MFDYHLHTSRCGHATGSMEHYLDIALCRGVREIGFADHFPLELLNMQTESPVSMRADELEDYIQDVKKLQKLATIPVRLGTEMDFMPGREQDIAKYLGKYNFDYVIGSIHFLDGWDFTHPDYVKRYELANIDELYEQYFTAIRQLAESNLFNIVGHLDVIKKFNFFPRKDWYNIIEETCLAIKTGDLAVELNTSGWRAPVKDAYPSEAFLDKCQELNIPVTLGSDAHRPKDVGSGLRRGVLLLHKLGFSEVAAFAEGKRTMHKLDDMVSFKCDNTTK